MVSDGFTIGIVANITLSSPKSKSSNRQFPTKAISFPLAFNLKSEKITLRLLINLCILILLKPFISGDLNIL